MTANTDTNLLVFRDTRTPAATQELIRQLSKAVAECLENRSALVDALIRAGELECALSDANSVGASPAGRLTDLLAGLHVLPGSIQSAEIQSEIHQLRTTFDLPARVLISPPEGFAYYALHPADFADFAVQFAFESPIVVIGIRSIGTTLSAVFAAALKKKGNSATRITVRPTGHPYDRRTEFSWEQLQWVDDNARSSAQFVVVDEGPGLSGSSFLSTGEALTTRGIHSNRVTFVGTREPDPAKLCAENAKDRWSRFRHPIVCPQFYGRFPQTEFLCGGAWRKSFLGSDSEWPACWPQMERLKFRSADGKLILKFDGLGRFGQRVRERADCMFRNGFGPSVEDAGDGLTAYGFIPGQPFTRTDVSSSIIELMARYCAVRSREFAVRNGSHQGIAEMVRHNLQQQLNLELKPGLEISQEPCPVVADGRMQPHEWIRSSQTILKVDGCTHGDDHFLPGPVDIAWDLAGAIVEWNLAAGAEDLLVAQFHRLSGNNPRPRLPAFVIAYGAFRLAYSRMAMLAVQDSAEAIRWQEAYQFYRERLMRDLRGAGYSENGIRS